MGEQTADYLREQLGAFAAAVHDIPSVEEPPPTTLEVRNRRQREEFWNRLLRACSTQPSHTDSMEESPRGSSNS